MSQLTIVGAGRVGKTLGNLIVANRVADVGQIYDCDIACARAAVEFVGAGRPVDDLGLLEPADICLLSTVEFAEWIGLPVEDEFENLVAWRARVKARPSANA